jgi:hypothetical protein
VWWLVVVLGSRARWTYLYPDHGSLALDLVGGLAVVVVLLQGRWWLELFLQWWQLFLPYIFLTIKVLDLAT